MTPDKPATLRRVPGFRIVLKFRCSVPNAVAQMPTSQGLSATASMLRKFISCVPLQNRAQQMLKPQQDREEERASGILLVGRALSECAAALPRAPKGRRQRSCLSCSKDKAKPRLRRENRIMRLTKQSRHPRHPAYRHMPNPGVPQSRICPCTGLLNLYVSRHCVAPPGAHPP